MRYIDAGVFIHYMQTIGFKYSSNFVRTSHLMSSLTGMYETASTSITFSKSPQMNYETEKKHTVKRMNHFNFSFSLLAMNSQFCWLCNRKILTSITINWVFQCHPFKLLFWHSVSALKITWPKIAACQVPWKIPILFKQMFCHILRITISKPVDT